MMNLWTDTRYRYGFKHEEGRKFFGPYENLTDAAMAFQRVYGYWPDLHDVLILPYWKEDV